MSAQCIWQSCTSNSCEMQASPQCTLAAARLKLERPVCQSALSLCAVKWYISKKMVSGSCSNNAISSCTQVFRKVFWTELTSAIVCFADTHKGLSVQTAHCSNMLSSTALQHQSILGQAQLCSRPSTMVKMRRYGIKQWLVMLDPMQVLLQPG